MEVLNNIETESVVKTQKAKEKKTKEKLEVGALKIQAPTEISQKIIDLQSQLKDRGYTGKVDDILSIIWDQINADWCEARLEALTPDEYYLNAVKNLPDIRQKIVDQAKKALIKAREESGKGNA
jgi:hypothetical protein